MKTILQQFKKLCLISLVILLFLPSELIGQEKEHSDPPDKKIKEAARKIMTSVETCALITLDKEGRPRARAMDPFAPEDDFTVWFGTNANSRKVAQIKNDPRVTLYYLENNDAGYLMIYGTAELIDDAKEKEKRWKPEWEAFYPNDRKDYLQYRLSGTAKETTAGDGCD